MFDTSAPYVVTALVSLISWVLSTFYAETKSTPYLKYEIVSGSETNGSKALRFRFTNLSPFSQIEKLNVSLVCRDGEACLGRTVQGVKQFATAFNVSPWSMGTAISPSAFGVTQEIKLPPGMSFEIECYVSKDSKDPSILVGMPNGGGATSTPSVKIVGSQPFELWFARNYLSLLFIFWIGAAGLIVIAYLNRPKLVKKAPEATALNVQIKRWE